MDSQRQLILQQNNARSHTERLAQYILARNNINTIDLYAVSPDLNPIQYHLYNIELKIPKRHLPPLTLHEPRDAVVYAYYTVPTAFIWNHFWFIKPTMCRSDRNNCGYIRY